MKSIKNSYKRLNSIEITKKRTQIYKEMTFID